MKKLDGLKIIVSGGGSGIGLEIARNLIEQGAQVCITGRNADKLRSDRKSVV